MKISPLNKYNVEKSYIVDKHDPNHDKTKKLHPLIFWWRMCTLSYLTAPPPGRKQIYILHTCVVQIPKYTREDFIAPVNPK